MSTRSYRVVTPPPRVARHVPDCMRTARVFDRHSAPTVSIRPNLAGDDRKRWEDVAKDAALSEPLPLPWPMRVAAGVAFLVLVPFYVHRRLTERER